MQCVADESEAATQQGDLFMSILESTESKISEDIQNFLTKNQEVLIITANPVIRHPDFIIKGESTIAVYSKLLDNEGIIAPMLNNILRNLIATKDGKRCNIENQAAINT
tara:strand:- start:344 stop:670 length:327 start_codon:yes stop_codon:yes gene_type:complete